MDWLSGFAVLLSAVVIVRQLWGVVITVGRIDLPGRVGGTAGAWALLVMMGVLGMTRPGYAAEYPMVYFTAAALLVSFIAVRAGLGNDGAYYNGQRVPWGEIEYFMVIRETRRSFSLRLHMRSGRDHVILYSSHRREAVIGRLTENGVHDWDEFVFSGDDAE